MEQFSASSVQLSLKPRPCFETPFSQRLQSTFGSFLNAFQISLDGTPARYDLRRRYTCLYHAASAAQGSSRQTDFNGPALQRNARFCHAFLLLSVTAAQRFKGSGKGAGKGSGMAMPGALSSLTP
jgi:hypothetical protein